MSINDPEWARLPERAQVVVIGGGILGASAAFHLTRMGTAVVLVDRGPLASETSSQGAGFLCSIRSSTDSAALGLYSSRFYNQFEQETGFRIDLHMVGGLRVALSAAWMDELRHDAAASEMAGVESREVTPTEIADLAPVLAADQAVGGLIVPFEGYVTATRDAALGLARGAERAGAVVRTHVEVTSIEPLPSRQHRVETSAGVITADAVILAANAGIWPLARDLGWHTPAYPILHQCAVYSLPTTVDDRTPTMRLPERDLYVRPDFGALMIGGVGTDPDGPAPDADSSSFLQRNAEPDRQESLAARERSLPYFPGMSHGTCIREQRGWAMVTPDLEALAGEWTPGLYVMTADLRGIQAGPALGLMVAQLISAGESQFDHTRYRPTRFARPLEDPTAMREAARRAIRPRWRT